MNCSSYCVVEAEAAVKLPSVMQYAEHVLPTTAGVNQLWLACPQPLQHTQCLQTRRVHPPVHVPELKSRQSHAHLLPPATTAE